MIISLTTIPFLSSHYVMIGNRRINQRWNPRDNHLLVLLVILRPNLPENLRDNPPVVHLGYPHDSPPADLPPESPHCHLPWHPRRHQSHPDRQSNQRPPPKYHLHSHQWSRYSNVSSGLKVYLIDGWAFHHQSSSNSIINAIPLPYAIE